MKSKLEPHGRIVFLTGATGFLGKVVLHDLMRRRAELQIEKVIVIIRPLKGPASTTVGSGSAKSLTKPSCRFSNEVAASACFSRLSPDWIRWVEPVLGDLEKPHCGLNDTTYNSICLRVTHVIHCAASIQFDLPLSSALRINVNGSLNVLELAKSSTKIQRLVCTSTAYVTPHDPERVLIPEELASLSPWPSAQKLLDDVYSAKVDEKEILQQTGHPNTYTLTKCIAEHMLLGNCDQMPITIVRPSIVGSGLNQPYPGWTDNLAALTGVILATSQGTMEELAGRSDTALDVVPVDFVAGFLITETFAELGSPSSIVHCVAGLNDCMKLSRLSSLVSQYFRHGEWRWEYDKCSTMIWLYRSLFWRLPCQILKTTLYLSGQLKSYYQLQQASQRISKLNGMFRYFSTHTFNFLSSRPTAYQFIPQFSQDSYLQITCRGVQQYVMRQNHQRGRVSTEKVVAGKEAKGRRNINMMKLFLSSSETWIFRMAAVVTENVFVRIFDKVTVDERSFCEALENYQPDTEDERLLILPSHRSYLDFVLCPYIFYSMPHLGVKIPCIAAQNGFASLPVVGRVLSWLGAFYIQRGLGRRDPQLDQQVKEIVEAQKDMLFFIEGQRSRSRLFLPPRRGLLKSLQSTGKVFNALPISISYERIPEEESFLAEAKAQDKLPMRISGLFWWVCRMLLGGVKLGRVHIKCGKMQKLQPGTDVEVFSTAVINELQANTMITTYHLDSFIRNGEIEGFRSQDCELNPEEAVACLRRQLEGSGGKVLDGCLTMDQPGSASPILVSSLRNQWIHYDNPLSKSHGMHDSDKNEAGWVKVDEIREINVTS